MKRHRDRHFNGELYRPTGPERAAHQRYETLKTVWTATHPRATPAERQAALLRLAMECGL